MVKYHKSFTIKPYTEEGVKRRGSFIRAQFAKQAGEIERERRKLPKVVRSQVPSLKWPGLHGPEPQWKLVGDMVHIFEEGRWIPLPP